MKARELDRKFDDGKSISKHLDLSKARRLEQEQKRVNVDFPVWMIQPNASVYLDNLSSKFGLQNV